MERSQNKNTASDASGSRAVPDVNSQPNDDDSNKQDNTIQNPATVALVEYSHTTTKAGKPRQRMKWTTELNKSIMRSYYKATNLEREMTAYRTKMHSNFIQENPAIQVTEQRVADQRRTIINNKLLPATIINEIRIQVQEELNVIEVLPEAEENLGREEITQNQGGQPILEIQESTETQIITQNNMDNQTDEMANKLEETFIQYKGTDPVHRPPIPRQNTSRKLASIVTRVNRLLLTFTDDVGTFEDLHCLIYSAALVSAMENGAKIRSNEENQQRISKIPSWQKRLEVKIENLRRNVNRLTEYKQGNRSTRLKKIVECLLKNCRNHSKYEETNNTIDEHLDTLKQKLTAMSKRLRRYKEAIQRRQDNKLFHLREGQFYRKLNGNVTQINNGPESEDIKKYWKEIWSREVGYNKTASWIEGEKERVQDVETMRHKQIEREDVTTVINNTHNWKAPGNDHIHNYWLKKFTNVHEKLALYFNQFIEEPSVMPDFLTQGLTYLLPKTGDLKNPANYRPITCLPSVYKILTACISESIHKHCERNNILAEQQKGCSKRSQGCKEQLIIDSVVMKQAHKTNRNLYTAYIDYRKAFDSVPHEWLIQVLDIYKVSPTVIHFLEHIIGQWKTSLITTNRGKNNKISIQIKRGIFQGDSLSPLWFCLALNPLSSILNSTNKGYLIEKRDNYRLSHLLYMDDIKVYCGTSRDLKHNLTIIEMFSKDIAMTFGLEKCKTQSICRGKREVTKFELETTQGVIEGMEEGDVYKYLGIKQSRMIEEKITKEEITTKYTERIKSLTKTKLHSKNLIKAINTYATPLLMYTFGVINWTTTDLKNIQRITSKILTSSRYHHKNSAVERLTLPRIQGGRGLTDILNLMSRQKNNLKKYFLQKTTTSQLHRTVVAADRGYSPLDLSAGTEFQIVPDEEKHTSWLQKALHGRHAHTLNLPNVDKAASNAWLTCGSLFPETEGFMCAIQDQVINTKNYKKFIIKDGTTDDSCRRCHGGAESIQHIVSGCPYLANTEYKLRHDTAAKIIHEALAFKYSLKPERTPHYKYSPEKILENGEAKMYWDRTIITDKTILHNRPDITLIDRSQSKAFLIDISIPESANLQTVHNEKIRKYEDLRVEVKKQWRVESVCVVPIIVSATGIVPRTLHDGLSQLALSTNIYITIQKSVILSTCSIVRKFLNDNS